MNGPQDLGGAHGFGPVRPEPDEPTFHDDWERRAFALTLAAGATGFWTLDRSRHARETLPPPLYLKASYYEIWLTAVERLIAEALAAGRKPQRVLAPDTVRTALAAGGPTERNGPAPRFALGDRVRVRPMRPAHHSRAPRYVHGRIGTVVRRHGAHVFPDTNAHGEGEQPTPLYTVQFAAADLWGVDTTATSVHADLFEPYLEPA